MILATTYRIGSDPTGKRTRLYVPKEILDVLEELNITILPIYSLCGYKDLCRLADGLILAGSYADTHPKYYGEKPIEGKIYDVDEYEFDAKVLKEFVDNNKPVLGICGGLQEINVCFGGSLNQRIEGHCIDNNHNINIKNNTFLFDTYKSNAKQVNSLHYQCIKDVAPNFIVSAISDDNIVEAIEKDNIIAVQWHPEIMKDMDFFKNFINKYLNKQ